MDKKPMNANEILLAHLTPEAPQSPEPTQPETTSNAEVKVEEPQKVETTQAPTTEVKLDDWDTVTPPSEPAPVEEKFDFNAFVKDLGIEAKSPTELKEKLKPSTEDVWAGVDPKLRKAIEFSKKGGDYLALLGVSSVDYSKINPTQLYESTVLNDPNYTPEEAKELLDSLSPLQKKERGLQLRNEYERHQKAQIAQFEESLKTIENSKAERKAKADRELKSTLDKVEKIAGLSVQPHHKKDIFEAITTGRMQQELFFDSKTGDYDYQSMIETYFVKKNLPKILEHIKKITSSETLRNHIKETSNVNLDKTREAPAPVVEQTSNPLFDAIERSRQGKSMGLK